MPRKLAVQAALRMELQSKQDGQAEQAVNGGLRCVAPSEQGQTHINTCRPQLHQFTLASKSQTCETWTIRVTLRAASTLSRGHRR